MASSSATLTVRALAEDLFHVRILRRGEVPSPSRAVVRADSNPGVARVECKGRHVRVVTSAAQFQIHKMTGAWKVTDRHGLEVFSGPAQGTGFRGREAHLTLVLQDREAIFGLGAGTGSLDQRGYLRQFGNREPSDTSSALGFDLQDPPISVPFAISLRDGRVAGLFWDNPAGQVWDLGHTESNSWKMSAIDGPIDLYLFTGPGMARILSRYTELTGRLPLPPRWSLGYHHSGAGPGSRGKLESLATEFRRRQLPCDGLTQWAPHPAAHPPTPGSSPPTARAIARLSQRGFKAVVVAESGSGLMIDSHPEGELSPHRTETPWKISRSGYAGLQRRGTVWVSGSGPGWDHLGNLLPALLNLGLSGAPMAGFGPDGFHGTRTPELFVRWLQMAVFTPLLMNHTQLERPLEPWVFGSKIEAIARAFLRLRYQLVPTLYGLVEEASRTGAPLVRPLLWHHANDPVAAVCSDQFLVGEHLLVAPVVKPGVAARSVYVPRGEWFDFWTGELLQGGVHVVLPAPLDRIPVLVRSGTLLAMTPARQFIGPREPGAVVLHVWPRDSGVLNWYDDDGRTDADKEGIVQRRRIRTEIHRRSGRLEIGAAEGPYAGAARTWRIVLRGVTRDYSVRILGKEVRAEYVPEIGVLAFDMPVVPGRLEACWR